ncbi:MAG: methyltransferase domain-containing protein [Planctomycetota bacterium]|nr:methyltransferase domain-containing protein [Planctomycetota bacterium]
MTPFLLPILACPDCGAPLAAEAGGLRCPAGHGAPDFAVEGGIPRLLPAGLRPPREARTVAAFERQWRRYGGLRRIFGKDPAAMTANLTGARLSARVDQAWYAGRRVLDAGCGHGRYLPAFAALGAEVVGLDIGRGPELAGAPTDDPRIALVQGSVLAPPFRPESFDLVFSDGVIHHTPDAGAAYAALARLVKPGGALYVWVYPREGRLREAVFGLARAITTRLPGPIVRALCFALAPLTVFVRSYSGTTFGRATWAECAQVVHDWLAPPLQSHHSHAEVAGWAAAAGLGAIEQLPIPTGVTAWRPLRAQREPQGLSG